MKKRDFFFLFLVGIIIYILFSCFQKVPGYMDAEYYFGQGIQLVKEHNLQELFIWNYLNNPSVLPSAGFSFWLPFTSFLAAAGIWITGAFTFLGSRSPFILMAASIPLITAKVAFQLLPQRRAAWLAGGIALFSGLFFPYITITDTFTPYMFLGGLFFLSCLKNRECEGLGFKSFLSFTLTGIVIGLMALTRSEGILWLVGGFFWVLIKNRSHQNGFKQFLIKAGILLIGFLTVMSPWYVRNYQVFGAIFPQGNSLMLWLTKYDELFVYPSSLLSLNHLLSQGFKHIITDRLSASWMNIQTLVSAGGAVLLFPLMLAGFWRNRKNFIVFVGGIMICILFLVMSIVFPFAGERGGFFHSLSSLQIFLWSLVPSGLDEGIRWGVGHRNWTSGRAWRMFGPVLIVYVSCYSIITFFSKINNGVENVPWNDTQIKAILIDEKIKEISGDKSGIVMINNPPGFTLATGRMSIMIPYSDAASILSACDRFHVDFLVLDGERSEVKKQYDSDWGLKKAFHLIYTNGSVEIYEFLP